MLMIAGGLAPRHANAQVPAAGEPGPYVLDLRGAMAGVPQTSEFYPTLPASTQIAARGFGIEAGAHVYFGRLGAAKLGFGATFIQARAKVTTVITPSSSSSSSSSSDSSSSSTSTSSSTTTATNGTVDV